jgi:hypothetical protein
MFRWFLDATHYWFDYSDNSSTGSYDPARECFVVLANNQANPANAAEAGDEEVPPARELDRSPTPEPPGTRVFSREIRTASFPQRFRQPTSIDKYTGETDPMILQGLKAQDLRQTE